MRRRQTKPTISTTEKSAGTRAKVHSLRRGFFMRNPAAAERKAGSLSRLVLICGSQ